MAVVEGVREVVVEEALVAAAAAMALAVVAVGEVGAAASVVAWVVREATASVTGCSLLLPLLLPRQAQYVAMTPPAVAGSRSRMRGWISRHPHRCHTAWLEGSASPCCLQSRSTNLGLPTPGDVDSTALGGRCRGRGCQCSTHRVQLCTLPAPKQRWGSSTRGWVRPRDSNNLARCCKSSSPPNVTTLLACSGRWQA